MGRSAKRKRTSSYSISHNTQRARSASLLDDPDSGVPPEFFKLRAIIAEDRSRYKIDWEDNSVTGEKYPPTWEPKANANREAVEDWERTKQRKKAAKQKGKGTVQEKEKEKTASTPDSTGPSSRGDSVNKLVPSRYKPIGRRRGIVTISSSTSTNNSQPVSNESAAESGSRGGQAQEEGALVVNDRHRAETRHSKKPRTVQVEISKPEGFDPDNYSQHSGARSLNEPARSQDRVSKFSLEPSQERPQTIISIHSDPQRIAADSLSLLESSSFDPASYSQSALGTEPATSNLPRLFFALSSRERAVFGHPHSDPIEDNSSPIVGPHIRRGDLTFDSSPQRRHSSTSSPPPSVPAHLDTNTLEIHQEIDVQESSATHPKSTQSQVLTQKNCSSKEKTNSEPSEVLPSAQIPTSFTFESFLEIPETQLQSQPQSRRSTPASEAVKTPHRQDSVHSEHTESETFQTQIPFVLPKTSAEGQEERSLSESSSTNSHESPPDDHLYDQPLTSSEILQSRQVIPEPDLIDSQIISSHNLDQSSQASTKSSILSERDPNARRGPHASQEKVASSQSVIPDDSRHRLIDSVELAETSILPELEPYSTLGYIPTPPDRPSLYSMSESRLSASSPELSLKERIRNLRANSALGRNADGLSPGLTSRSLRSTKSPSAIPGDATQAPVAPVETQTSLRPHEPHPTIEMHEPIHVEVTSAPAAEASPIEIPTLSIARPPRQGPMQFYVPLPMNARVRDQYEQSVYNYRAEIEQFTGLEESAEWALMEKMVEMIDSVKRITLHPDLENSETATQQNVPERDEAKWAEYCSGKFLFLRHLVDQLRSREEHIAILAQPGRMLDIIEVFLRGNNVVYTRPDKHSSSKASAVGPMNVTILPTGEEGSGMVVGSASAVIAFDISFNADDEHVRKLRAHLFNVGQLAPVISLIVVNSAEHIELCLPPNLEPLQRMQALVSCIAQTRHEVGELALDMPHADEAATLVATYVGTDRPATAWPLPPLLGMPALDAILEAPSATQASTSETEETAETADVAAELTSASRKRSLEPESQEIISKKARLTPQPGAATTLNDVTHVSDSVGGPSTLDTTQSSAGDVAARLESVEKQLGQKSELEKELRDKISKSEARLQEHIEAMSELQTRYENRDEEIRTARRERDAAVSEKELLGRRREKQAEEITKLKDSRSELQKELDNTRASLSASTIPEVAELERAHADARLAQAEKARLEHRLASTTRDFEFTRTQYQTASSAAAESAHELGTLREENEVLRRKASGDALKLHALNASTRADANASRVRELELLLEDREEQLRRKDEELKAHLRGRGVSTRASSVPRSPKPLSRAGSPVPPAVRPQHPLRNAG
ncbi:MAG: hypothetical protein M4579_003052 [Chaenotheca gracillima]|nr:MAG: hypothetical protein M4579_003052 [Chaenotheca gracillima]